MEKISYKVKTATKVEIQWHLEQCDEKFIPKLSSTVDLATYAQKIFENAITFEAWQNGILIGIVAAYFNNLTDKIGYITNVSTLPNFAGKGIGFQLVKNTINYANENLFVQIKLEVNEKNTHAIQLYKKFNFQELFIANNFLTMQLNLNNTL